MAKQPVATDAVALVLTNQVVDLQRQVTDLRRDLESAQKENKMLWAAMERPSVSTLTTDQVHMLAEMLFQSIMGVAITKKEERPA